MPILNLISEENANSIVKVVSDEIEKVGKLILVPDKFCIKYYI